MSNLNEKAVSFNGMSRSEKTALMVKLAMLSAVSLVLVAVIRLPFPPAPFLVYDPADIPIFIGTFAFGPAAGVLITLVVSAFQALLMSSDGIIGFTMHVFATGSFVLVAGSIYKRHKSKKVAVAALLAGIVAMTVSMVIWNILFTPLFMHAPRADVMAMILPIIVPFNVLKAGVNSLVTFLLYKSIAKYLHR